uniref:Peptidase S1 domain-containing protein n=1 Tax=Glossina austeni TaxID=7395 RepID=A0A1A9VA29_GLOAU
MFQFFYYCAIFFLIIKSHPISAQDCDKELNKEQKKSTFAKYTVWVRCKIGKNRHTPYHYHIGVILSKHTVLTANSMKLSGTMCTVLYHDINFEVIDITDRSEALTVANYENIKDIGPHWSLPQLKLITTETIFNMRRAAIMLLPDQEYKATINCVVVTHNDKKRLIQRKTVVLQRAECESAYPGLHKNIICIQAQEGTCKFDPCLAYKEEGAPLICDGVLTAIVTKDINKCEATKPCLAAKVYESRDWIERNMRLFTRNSVSKNGLVTIQFGVTAFKWIKNAGAILSDRQVLTNCALNRPYKGQVMYNDGRAISFRKAKSFNPDWRAKPNKIQLSIVRLEGRLNPKVFEILPIRLLQPTEESICVVTMRTPEWVKLEVTFLDDNICREELPEYHNECACIQPKYEGIQLGKHLLGGTSIICDGELTAITAYLDQDAKHQPIPCTFLYKHLPWLEITRKFLDSNAPTKCQSVDKLLLLFLLILHSRDANNSESHTTINKLWVFGELLCNAVSEAPIQSFILCMGTKGYKKLVYIEIVIKKIN